MQLENGTTCLLMLDLGWRTYQVCTSSHLCLFFSDAYLLIDPVSSWESEENTFSWREDSSQVSFAVWLYQFLTCGKQVKTVQTDHFLDWVTLEEEKSITRKRNNFKKKKKKILQEKHLMTGKYCPCCPRTTKNTTKKPFKRSMTFQQHPCGPMWQQTNIVAWWFF